MNPITDIDTLIAALYPHIHQYREGALITAPPSLRPNKYNTDIHDLVDAFANLFGLYPDCETVAVAIQTPLRMNTSLYICPSPPTLDGFDSYVNDCLKQLMMAVLPASNAEAHGEGDISQSERCFIMHAYSLCYAAMRQRAMIDKRLWNSLVNPHKPKDETEAELREKVSDDLTQLSELVGEFVETISRHEVTLGDDTLQFHTLCLQIRETMEDEEFESYINKYLYLQSVDHLLAYYFRLPIAISKLLSLSARLKSSFDYNLSAVIVKPSRGARQFKAMMAVDHLRTHFALAGGAIEWKEVDKAFTKDVELWKERLRWDNQKHMLSTEGPVIPHPEVTLIDLFNDDKPSQGLEAYIACSTMPCYASVAYAGVVNGVLEERQDRLKFTMRTDDPEWCRLSTAKPWILPENTTTKVVENLKNKLLEELESMMHECAKDERGMGRF